MAGQRIEVTGRVQGVGFRPYVWRLARKAGLTGQVLNDAGGVRIEVWGRQAQLQDFTDALQQDPPPLARIETLRSYRVTNPPPRDDFIIAQSGGGPVTTEITPDAATCPDCLREVFDPADRRHGYAFTNCTHCGPRLSIVEGIPYDRARTSMRGFAICADCLHEYQDPQDRRFHAQPNACPACGPQVWLEDTSGRIACTDPIARAAKMLALGRIVAIKGIGGFHLACDAHNAAAVQTLRDRKNRVAKPLALMVGDLTQLDDICHLSDAEADLLKSPAAPIVLLQMRTDAALPGIAPGLDRIGVMLAHSPLHHLLLAQCRGPLVMTSGNPSGLPQVTDNADARTALAGIADAWLMHDRAIVNRLDDSIMRMDAHAASTLRRSRGLAPAPVHLHDAFAKAPPILAMGATQKATFCLIRNGNAIPSEHIGDLTTAETYADFRNKINLFRDLYDLDPEVIAVDMHPDYLSARWGRQLARDTGARLIAVQHHHAHLASTLAEHQIVPEDARTVGVILDGTGMGTDGTIWGGEILVGDYGGFERRAHFQPIALPGGEAAVRAPWRNLVAHLRAAFGPEWRGHITGTPLADRLAPRPTTIMDQMIAKGVNAPLASSAGRLFDAVAAALGIALAEQHYEGQAAMELEALVEPELSATGYPIALSEAGILSWTPLWQALIADLIAGVSPGTIATRFHLGLGDALVTTAAQVATSAGINRIALSGGVMQNRFLHQHLWRGLGGLGFEVLSQSKVSANDGGISLGQAVVAAQSA